MIPEQYNPDLFGQCETCDWNERRRNLGFCPWCMPTLKSDGTFNRSGWVPKKQLTITTAPMSFNASEIRDDTI